MALVGTFKHYAMVQSETETESFTFIVPEDVPEDNPDYPLRGQEKTVTQPVMVEELINIITDCYVVVKAVAVHLEDTDRLESEINISLSKGFRVNIMYNVYESKNARLLGFNYPYLANQNSEIFYIDLSEIDNNNLLSWAYSKLKTMKGFEDLIDD